MTRARTVAELFEVLREERDALRGMQADRVLALSEKKEALFRRFLSFPMENKEEVEEFARLFQALSHNGVLAAHARALIKDGIDLLRRRTAPPRFEVTG